MKTQHTFSLSFFLKKDKETGGNAPLYAKVTVNGKFKHLSTKKRIPVSDWHQKEQALHGQSPENDEARDKIRMLTGQINTAYDELRFKKHSITAEAIKALVEGRDDEQVSLKDLLKYHEEGVGQLLAEGTVKNYSTTERLLEEFLLVKKRKKDIALIQLDPKFITDFGTFLRLRKPDKGQRPCSNNTVMKHMERLKKLTNIAIDNKWIIEDPFRRFERHIIKKDREALDEFELERLEEAVLLEAGHVIVQDMFLFSCYTGLGYSEACNFNRSHITRDREGNYWLEMCRKKTFSTTEQKFEVLLLPEALELIDKYKNNPVSLQKGTLFPSYSNQTTNRYLKVIATAEAELLIFSGKVSGKAVWSRGLFISYAGFTSQCLDAFARGKPTNLIGMDAQDIFFILEGKMDLKTALLEKVRLAAETNSFFISVYNLANH